MADYEVASTSTNTVDIVGLDNVKATLDLKLPQPLRTEGSNTIDVKPLKADLGTDTRVAIQPLKLELQTQPLKTDSSVSVDLKPAVVDLCLTTNVGKLPNVCIRQPYHHHVGLTLFGLEIWGVTFSGQQETVVEELDRQPKVAWSRAVATWPPQRPAASPKAAASTVEPAVREAGGLRVRLDR